jgi:transposase
MVHVHGAQVQRLAAPVRGLAPEQLLAVPIDVGKAAAMALVCDFTGELLVRPFEFAINRAGVAELTRRVEAVRAQRATQLVRIGIEAAGHDHPSAAGRRRAAG